MASTEPGWTFSGLAESPAAEHSGQPEEAVPEISEGGALGEDHEGHTIDPKVSEEGEAEENDDEGSEQDSQQPEEGGPGASEGAPASEGGEDALTKILMNFSRALAKVHESTKKIPRDQVKLTETIEKINEAVVRIERNSEHLNIRLAAVEANTAAIQTSMQAIQEKNRLHETGTHVISIRTTELAQHVEEQGEATRIHQANMFEQQSLIFNGLGAQNRTLQKISDFLEAAATDQSDNVASHDNENAAAGVSVMDGPADQYIANQAYLIWAGFVLIFVVTVIKSYEMNQGNRN